MASTCVNYLNSHWADDFEQNNINPTTVYAQQPFLKHASNHWAYHVLFYGDSNSVLFQALDDFLLNDSKAFASWLELRRHKSTMRWGKQCSAFPSALHIAAEEDLAHYVGHLIRLGQDVHCVDDIFRTPMHRGAAAGSASVVGILLSHGANLDPEDISGLRPLHLAALGNHGSVVKVLLEAGVNPHTPKTHEDSRRPCSNAPRTIGDTPVKYAFSYGHFDAALEFVPYFDTEAMSQALGWALEAGKTDIVSIVLGRVEVDVNQLTKGKTLLFLAAHQQDLPLIQRLLELGADSAILSYNCFERSIARPLQRL